LREVLQGADVAPCAKCGNVIAHLNQCPHLRCPMCGFDYCNKCLRPFRGPDADPDHRTVCDPQNREQRKQLILSQFDFSSVEEGFSQCDGCGLWPIPESTPAYFCVECDDAILCSQCEAKVASDGDHAAHCASHTFVLLERTAASKDRSPVAVNTAQHDDMRMWMCPNVSIPWDEVLSQHQAAKLAKEPPMMLLSSLDGSDGEEREGSGESEQSSRHRPSDSSMRVRSGGRVPSGRSLGEMQMLLTAIGQGGEEPEDDSD